MCCSDVHFEVAQAPAAFAAAVATFSAGDDRAAPSSVGNFSDSKFFVGKQRYI
jgi:hypothetical protein